MRVIIFICMTMFFSVQHDLLAQYVITSKRNQSVHTKNNRERLLAERYVDESDSLSSSKKTSKGAVFAFTIGGAIGALVIAEIFRDKDSGYVPPGGGIPGFRPGAGKIAITGAIIGGTAGYFITRHVQSKADSTKNKQAKVRSH